ncbi:MAG TPA: ribosome-binding factor A [Candidatus Paceibacterota bacterium]|nr:ribosome-binding factor A [Candidatus Paceibacterota bacterium]
MEGNRNEKIQTAVHEVAAEFLAKEAGPQSLITVTRVMLSSDAKSATIFITVLPEKAEAAALDFAQRNRRELADFFRTKIRGAFPPFFEFKIDLGEKNRQRLDEIS